MKQQNVSRQEDIYPLVYYYIAYGYQNLHRKENTEQANCYMTMYVTLGENAAADGCFPHRTEDYIVLKSLAEEYHLPWLTIIWDACSMTGECTTNP